MLRKRIHDLPLGRRRIRVRVRVLQLEQQPLLPRDGVSDLGNLVPGPSNLDDVPPRLRHADGQSRGGVYPALRGLALLLLLGRTPREVRLVLLALGVREVGAVILVNRETQTALERADVVLEEVRILVKVDSLEGELSKTFATVGVCGGLRGYTSTTEFRAGAVLKIHIDEEAVIKWERVLIEFGSMLRLICAKLGWKEKRGCRRKG